MGELKNQGEVEVEAINLWATPRSLSTSLMYSFAQRDDIEVLDEPFCATFLRLTGFDRPYREEALSKMEPDGNEVVNNIILGPGKKKYRFCKMGGWCKTNRWYFQPAKKYPTVKEAIFRTLIWNGMFDNSHIRLSLPHGKKVHCLPISAFYRD